MQSLSSHLLEMRLRFIYINLACILSIIVSYMYRIELVYIVSRPFLKFHREFIFLDLTEAFYTIIRITGIISLISVLPLVTYHFWCFFIPSYYKGERKKINKLFLVFFTFFLIQLVVIYFFIFPKICEFLMSFEIKSLENTIVERQWNLFSVELAPRIESYFKLTFRFFIIILSVFQIPFIFMIFYSKRWITSYDLCDKRKYIFFLCVIFSAFISPPDIISQLILSSFTYLVYEFIIIIGLFYQPLSTIPKM